MTAAAVADEPAEDQAVKRCRRGSGKGRCGGRARDQAIKDQAVKEQKEQAIKEQAEKDKSAKDHPAAKPAKDIQAQFDAMLKSPTRDNFLAVQELLVADKAYSPYSQDLKTMGDLVKKEKYGEVEAEYKKTWPNLVLSPQAHFMLATAAKGLGDQAKADKENAAEQKCLDGLLATGDGTEAKPIRVTRISDEYDIVHLKKKGVDHQALKVINGKVRYHVPTCRDGSEMWFDVSIPFDALKKSLEKDLKN